MKNRRMLIAGAAMLAGVTGVGGVALANGGRDHFHVNLRGANEVPPADSDGRGTAKLEINTESGEICWSLRFDRIATPTMAHIHGQARVGENAGVKVLFFDPTHPVSDLDALERGRADGCTTADPALASDIATHPELYYVNIHNARFMGGAIRGQVD